MKVQRERKTQTFAFVNRLYVRVALISEFDQLPNIFVHEEFPNTKYRIVFVHEKFPNTKYQIVFVHEILRKPNNK